MNIVDLPWALILFLVGQTLGAVWFISNLNADVKNLKSKVDHMEKEYEAMRKELREMRDILVKVEHNTGLLMLGRIKTGSKGD